MEKKSYLVKKCKIATWLNYFLAGSETRFCCSKSKNKNMGWVSCLLFNARPCLYIYQIYNLKKEFACNIFKRARDYLFAHS